MRWRALIACGIVAVFALAPCMSVAQAQPGEAALRRAIDLENAAKYREAAAAYRDAIVQGAIVPGMLGLERAFGSLGQEDSVLPPLESLLRAAPRDPALRGVLVRTLRALGRDAAARRAYEEWRALDPRDPAPYREFVRVLLLDRRTGTADSVLRQAVEARGSAHDFATEFADLYVAMGRWDAAATAWREAIVDDPFLDQSAAYALMGAPPASRDGVRRALAPASSLPSVVAHALIRAVALLELRWGAPRDAWRALSTLPPSDSTAQAWIDFADEAEHAGGPLAARDALEAAFRVRRDPALALRAATNALGAGDAPGALRLATDAARMLDSARAASEALPLRVRALAEMGMPQDAEALIERSRAHVTDVQRRLFSRALAWGWIRVGDIARARRSAALGGGEDEDVVSGWLALFDGDLDGARSGLRTAEPKTPEIVTALAVISRAKTSRAPSIGVAFLALTRGDSARASQAFEAAAASAPDAASFLLALAARVSAARGDDARALALWQRIADAHPASPEAPEADLEWARALERRGDRAGATARYEHLILTFTDSALVPQAREALDRLRLALPH